MGINAWDCKCKRCGDPHNNVDGKGYCKRCQRVNRILNGQGSKKLEGVLLPL